jgi:hypothetical protein
VRTSEKRRERKLVDFESMDALLDEQEVGLKYTHAK